MEWQQLIMDIFVRISQELEEVLEGLTVDELNQQPRPDCNSIGWLAWHLTRGQDRAMADLMKEEQLWAKDDCLTYFHLLLAVIAKSLIDLHVISSPLWLWLSVP